MNSEQIKLLKRYYRLVLSYKDFKHAKRCAEWLSLQDDYYNPENELSEAAYYSSSVVSYARPFNSGGQSKHGKIPRLDFSMLSNTSSSEQEIHEHVIHCRNKLIAHSDASAIDLEPIIATDMPGDFIVPLQNDALAPFTKSFSVEFSHLAEKWFIWVVEERHKLEPIIKPYLNKATWNEIHGISKDDID